MKIIFGFFDSPSAPPPPQAAPPVPVHLPDRQQEMIDKEKSFKDKREGQLQVTQETKVDNPAVTQSIPKGGLQI